jgi:hypothetical protein
MQHFGAKCILVIFSRLNWTSSKALKTSLLHKNDSIEVLKLLVRRRGHAKEQRDNSYLSTNQLLCFPFDDNTKSLLPIKIN